MTTTKQEAQRALRDIETAQDRSNAYSFYSVAGPIVAIWGVVWLVANVTSYFAPQWSTPIWLVGIASGTIASAAGGLRAQRKGGKFVSTLKAALMGLSVAVALAAGLTALAYVGGFSSRQQVNAVVSIIVAVSYIVMGVERGARMTILGLIVGATTVGGWLWLRPSFELWMGLIGGGALIIGGLWLRRT
jgi:hypothetical protein